jgi:hypothetical protein
VQTAYMASKDAAVPVVLHLDHATTYEDCNRAINAGFSSVMIDASALPYEENVALTRKVARRAHPFGVTVEGELGRLVGEEGDIIVKGPEAAQTEETADTQARLEQLLSSMDGVGRVELMLTTSGSEEIFYQTDTRVSGDTREETTVFSSTQSTQKTPVVTKTKSAPYLGAVVVCDGADSAAVRLRIMQAVSALTGLGSDKISVIKMKRQ